jgi:hypothetical protein
MVGVNGVIEICACPFCAFDDVEIDEIDLRVFAVTCPNCESMGPVYRASVGEELKGPVMAIELWNKRGFNCYESV